jgi:hypothetical protein
MRERPTTVRDVVDPSDGTLSELIVFRPGETETWRTTSGPESFFVEQGAIVLEIAYGEAGTIVAVELPSQASRSVPSGVHLRLRASFSARVCRMADLVA